MSIGWGSMGWVSGTLDLVEVDKLGDECGNCGDNDMEGKGGRGVGDVGGPCTSGSFAGAESGVGVVDGELGSVVKGIQEGRFKKVL